MTTSDARRDCVLYLSDVHGEFDTLSYLLGPWRDDLRWTHLIGDVYDRGPAPDKIIDMLMDYPDADIQWGNTTWSGWARHWVRKAASPMSCEIALATEI